jgi:hypothetical protein
MGLYRKLCLIYKTNNGIVFCGEAMDHNPNLKSRSLPEPNQVAGKGQIEKPCEVENIIHQTRPAPPTEYENQLGDALTKIFDTDIDQLPDVIVKLNEMGVQSPNGAAWTQDSFKAEIKRLGA